jgi:hypothetical protein
MATFDSQGNIPPVPPVGQNLVSKKITDKEGSGQKSPPPRRLKTGALQNPEAGEENGEDQHHIDIRV